MKKLISKTYSKNRLEDSNQRKSVQFFHKQKFNFGKKSVEKIKQNIKKIVLAIKDMAGTFQSRSYLSFGEPQ